MSNPSLSGNFTDQADHYVQYANAHAHRAANALEYIESALSMLKKEGIALLASGPALISRGINQMMERKHDGVFDPETDLMDEADFDKTIEAPANLQLLADQVDEALAAYCESIARIWGDNPSIHMDLEDPLLEARRSIYDIHKEWKISASEWGDKAVRSIEDALEISRDIAAAADGITNLGLLKTLKDHTGNYTALQSDAQILKSLTDTYLASLEQARQSLKPYLEKDEVKIKGRMVAPGSEEDTSGGRKIPINTGNPASRP